MHKAAEIVARFSGARKIAVCVLAGVPSARWGVCTGLDTWHGNIDGANYGALWLGTDGILRVQCPETIETKFLDNEILAISYRAKFEGNARHFRHEFPHNARPLVAYDFRNKILTLVPGAYRVTANGIVG